MDLRKTHIYVALIWITITLATRGYVAASPGSSGQIHCPTACKTCKEDKACTSCQPGKYGVSCDKQCLNCNGNVCNMAGYCMLGCTPGSYRAKDGEFCQHCFHRCQTCSSYSECGKCYAGYYGLGCEEDCFLCENSQCGKYGCTTGCKDGFYTEKVDDSFTKCAKCPTDYCLKCHSSDRCDECKGHFWGTFCDRICPAECPVWCEQNTGLCAICEDRQYIDSIGQCTDCPETCLSCTSVENCNDKCVRGYSGQRCEICSLTICIECLYDSTIGSATCKTCVSGRYGQFCDSLCSKECQSGDDEVPLCDSLNGTCLQGCVNQRYGEYCENMCSKGCQRADNGTSLCDFLNGTCLHGCVKGLWGPFCNQSCGVGCIGGTCNRSNSRCSCAHNYYGLSCNLSCSGKCHDPRNGSRICYEKDGKCLFNSEVYTKPGWITVPYYGGPGTLIYGLSILLIAILSYVYILQGVWPVLRGRI